MRTRSANGFGLEVKYQPEQASKLLLGAQFDYMRVPRSGAHPVTRDGRLADLRIHDMRRTLGS